MSQALQLIQRSLGLLSEAELRTLNTAVCERIRAANRAKTQEQMSAFYVGDLVEFHDRTGECVRVRVERLNVKTMSGVEIDGPRKGRNWRVHPSFCRLVGS